MKILGLPSTIGVKQSHASAAKMKGRAKPGDLAVQKKLRRLLLHVLLQAFDSGRPSSIIFPVSGSKQTLDSPICNYLLVLESLAAISPTPEAWKKQRVQCKNSGERDRSVLDK
ncbi:hypothetical protein AAC387_Pa11g0635 [Persea americana]